MRSSRCQVVHQKSTEYHSHPYSDIVVVGGGASAIAFLLALRRQVRTGTAPLSLDVTVVDRPDTMGTGRVYQEDLPVLRMNTPAQGLSLSRDSNEDFVSWLTEYTDEPPELLAERYASRELYGKYLRSLLNGLKSQNSPIQVETANGTVTAIHSAPCGHVLVTINGSKPICTESVVITIGPGLPSDPYNLRNHDRYVPTPFPAHQQLTQLPKASRVLILGTHLSAVDAALSLHSLGHRGSVLLASRRGLLPEVKSRYIAGPPAADLTRCWANFTTYGELPLRVLLRSYRTQLARQGISWHAHLRPEAAATVEAFECKVRRARARHSSSITSDHRLDEALELLSEQDMARFMTLGYPMLLHRHTAMPLENAERLLRILGTKQYEVSGGLRAVIPSRGGTFRCSFQHRADWTADHVINATGAARSICGPDPRAPIESLCKQQRIREPATGGARLARDGRILNAQSQPVDGIYAIGHLGIGTHPFINNIELIRSVAARVAEHLYQSISLKKSIGHRIGAGHASS